MISNKRPLLTIAIPTYNRYKFLMECLQHVIPQIDCDMEILVCDNASTDSTYDEMIKMVIKYPFIKYIRNNVNIGPDGNFLKCLKEGTGKYIHILSDDDILLDKSVSKIRKCMAIRNDYSLIFLNHTSFEGEFDLCKCLINAFPIKDDKEFSSKDEFVEYIGIYATFVSAMIFNKDIFDRIDKPEQYIGTYLFQSHILYRIVSLKEDILLIANSCIAARGGNSGGYNLYKVFSHGWKNVLFDTGLKSGYEYRVVNRIFNGTIKGFLKNWTIHLKINKNNYSSGSICLLLKDTYKYPSAWIYLYPVVLFPTGLFNCLRKIYRKLKYG
jgi:abequosyltransferase